MIWHQLHPCHEFRGVTPVREVKEADLPRARCQTLEPHRGRSFAGKVRPVAEPGGYIPPGPARWPGDSITRPALPDCLWALADRIQGLWNTEPGSTLLAEPSEARLG